MTGFRDRVLALCDRAVEATAGGPLHDEAVGIRERASGPLRVAIAGRVKAGKSTLLNALVSERLAPTDAGECTLLVSEYREDLTYDVTAVLRDGSRVALPFGRDGGALDVDLDGVAVDEVDRLEVGWPSSALRDLTLIDTPGLASMTADAQQRTLDYLAGDEVAAAGRADAVLYLMRHLHRSDAGFLETFSDHTLANASPVNAIAVLSRADEVGAGRPDAMASADRIARRYGADPRVRALASRVVPVAGLLAETGLTLRQDEYASLARIAAEDDHGFLLTSVDRFADAEPSVVAPEIRRELTERLGLFGLRVAIAAIDDGTVGSAPELSRHLVQTSGLPELRDLLAGHFAARATALKARNALSGLRSVARRLGDEGLLREVGEVEAGSGELADLRLVHLVLAGATRLTPDEVDEALRVTGGGSSAQRLGLPADAPADEVRTACLAAVDRWRTRRAHPMLDPTSAEACDLLARAHEELHAALG